jgi:hypothetical protein
VALAILAVAYAIMLIANISPPPSSGMQCPWQFPKIFSCVLGTNLAGGVLGAGGALFAAWIAWMAVQRQIDEQQRQARVVERAYISGGGAPLKERPDLFLLTVQNYGKTPGTVTAYALSVCDGADLPPEPDYLKPGYIRTPFIATYPPGGGTLPITTTEIPPLASKPIAYGRLWYKDIWGADEYHFSFIIPIKTPHDHTDLVDISKAYTSST